MFDLNIQMSQYLQQFLEAKMYKKNWHLVNSFYQMEIDNMSKFGGPQNVMSYNHFRIVNV